MKEVVIKGVRVSCSQNGGNFKVSIGKEVWKFIRTVI